MNQQHGIGIAGVCLYVFVAFTFREGIYLDKQDLMSI